MAREFERTLPVQLTVPELIERGYMLAQQNDRRSDIEGDKKEANEDFKKQLEIVGTEIWRLKRIVLQKAEPRPVKCREIRDYRRAVVEVVRLDTGELVESRVMTEAERQREIGEITEAEERPDIALLKAVGGDPNVIAAVEKIRPKKGSGIESVTFEVPGHDPVTLRQEGAE